MFTGNTALKVAQRTNFKSAGYDATILCQSARTVEPCDGRRFGSNLPARPGFATNTSMQPNGKVATALKF